MKRYSKLWKEIEILSKRELYLPGWQFYDLVKDYCVSQASQIHQQPHTIHDMAHELQTSSTFFRLLLDRIRNSYGRRRAEIFERAVLDAQQHNPFLIPKEHHASQSTIADAPQLGVWGAVERFAGYDIDKPDSNRPGEMRRRLWKSIKVWTKFIYPHKAMLKNFEETLSPAQQDSHNLIRRMLGIAIQFTGDSAMKIMKNAAEPFMDVWGCGYVLDDFLAIIVVSEAQFLGDEVRKRGVFISSILRTALMGYDHVLGLEAPLVIRARENLAAAYPWLKNKEDSKLPHYLWDLKTRQTRTTSEIMEEIGETPRYVVISHTWGRWRIEDQWVTVPGAKWDIPKITKFDVTRLPTMLENLRSTTTSLGMPVEYVWLDLLTIPQRGNQELLNQEIAKQATIFALAAHGFVWLNDVESWDRTEALLLWISVMIVKEIILSTKTETEVNIDPHLSLLAEKAFHPVELCDAQSLQSRESPVSGEISMLQKSNPWFTSLWTLQEAYLRTDMFLANKDWKLLGVSEHHPVTLLDLVSMVYYSGDKQESASLLNPQLSYGSPSLEGLVKVMAHSGLSDLLSPSRSNILHMASRRECTGRRAEAIMGVLDVTDWFIENPNPRDADLIKGLYPWEFLEEVRRKIGCVEFFSSSLNEDSLELKDILKKIAERTWTAEDLVVRGSLLPFAFDSTAPFLGKGEYVSHPTISRWVVNRDGTVHIPEVALLTILGDDDNCEIEGPDKDDWKEIDTADVNLNQWLREYVPEMANYAVCTHFNENCVSGLLLKEVNPGQLIKVGNFETGEDVEKHQTEMKYFQVNWIVL